MSFIDGVAYVDHRIFAFADRSSVDWYCHEDDKHWPLMILTPAEQPESSRPALWLSSQRFFGIAGFCRPRSALRIHGDYNDSTKNRVEQSASRELQYLGLPMAAALVHHHVVGRTPDARDSARLSALLNDVAHAISNIAPI